MKWVINPADFDLWCDAAKSLVPRHGRIGVEDRVAAEVSLSVFKIKDVETAAPEVKEEILEAPVEEVPAPEAPAEVAPVEEVAAVNLEQGLADAAKEIEAAEAALKGEADA